eukprot:scaffold1166_cov261-Pinguiococcus_pyrenoidosus.AAC.54
MGTKAVWPVLARDEPGDGPGIVGGCAACAKVSRRVLGLLGESARVARSESPRSNRSKGRLREKRDEPIAFFIELGGAAVQRAIG